MNPIRVYKPVAWVRKTRNFAASASRPQVYNASSGTSLAEG
jgi:hypothetical protein